MNPMGRFARPLYIVGSVAMLVGALDPLEGSIIIVGGVVCATIGASMMRSRHARDLSWSAGLVCVGVAALWIMSDRGGIGGDTGRSLWWGLTLLPYPVGWVLGMLAIVRQFRDDRATRRNAA